MTARQPRTSALLRLLRAAEPRRLPRLLQDDQEAHLVHRDQGQARSSYVPFFTAIARLDERALTHPLPLDTGQYACLSDLRTDINQIYVNAKRYNAPGSQIFLDAKKQHVRLPLLAPSLLRLCDLTLTRLYPHRNCSRTRTPS